MQISLPHLNKFFSFFAYQRIKYDAQCDITMQNELKQITSQFIPFHRMK